MHDQSTDVVRTKEELCLEVVRRGDISIDERGHVFRVRRRSKTGKLFAYLEPRRIDRPDHLGYCRLGFSLEGKSHIVYAHRLVWVAANGPIPATREVNHIDGNKENNALANLELVSRKGNMEHASLTGAWSESPGKHGEEHPNAKLTWEKVREMRRRFGAGEDVESLAEAFDTSPENAYLIVRRKRWKHDPGQTN